MAVTFNEGVALVSSRFAENALNKKSRRAYCDKMTDKLDERSHG
jgi:hypothetical protein